MEYFIIWIQRSPFDNMGGYLNGQYDTFRQVQQSVLKAVHCTGPGA